MFSDDELTRDAFLGGALHLHQPKAGYRAGVDPVLLAASVPARAGQRVLDLGCGAGAVALCLGARVAGLQLHGVEKQPFYADLAVKNADECQLDLTVWRCDLATPATALRQIQFHHVVANPPYFRANAHVASPNAGRAAAMGEVGEHATLAQWVAFAAQRLLAKGTLHMIQRTERLPDMLAACAGQLGSIEVLPLAAREGRAPENILLRARKLGRGPFRLHAPFVLHDGQHHQSDRESYRAEVAAILRNCAALHWPV
jgi:tRNA1(Val) A37 N6-methylase TrmN6